MSIIFVVSGLAMVTPLPIMPSQTSSMTGGRQRAIPCYVIHPPIFDYNLSFSLHAVMMIMLIYSPTFHLRSSKTTPPERPVRVQERSKGPTRRSIIDHRYSPVRVGLLPSSCSPYIVIISERQILCFLFRFDVGGSEHFCT